MIFLLGISFYLTMTLITFLCMVVYFKRRGDWIDNSFDKESSIFFSFLGAVGWPLTMTVVIFMAIGKIFLEATDSITDKLAGVK